GPRVFRKTPIPPAARDIGPVIGSRRRGAVHRIDRFAPVRSGKARPRLAFVCGVLSGPHDRYGARIAWIATFTAAIAILRAIKALLLNPRGKGAWLKLAPSRAGARPPAN